MARALRGEQQPAHDFLYWEFHERGFQQAVRMGRWKAVRLKKDAPLELYDLAADPGEQHDVAAANPEVVAQDRGVSEDRENRVGALAGEVAAPGRRNRMGVLRRVFGPSKKKIWTQLSTEIGAQVQGRRVLEGRQGPGHARRMDGHARYLHGLDRQDHHRLHAHAGALREPERLSLQGVSQGNLQRRRQVVRHAGYRGARRAVRLRFHHQGHRREQGSCSSLRIAKIRELIAAPERYSFRGQRRRGMVWPDVPRGRRRALFVVVGVIKDVERLKLLYELFAETLEQLCRIGAAYEQSPDLAL